MSRFWSLKREFYSSRRNTNEYKESHVYFQGSPVCLEAGRKNVRFFAEFGYGAQGMGQMGIKYTLKMRKRNDDVHCTLQLTDEVLELE